MNNKLRAQRAENSINHGADDNDIATKIIDLLCNLRHLCDKENLEFEHLDFAANEHYTAEIKGEL